MQVLELAIVTSFEREKVMSRFLCLLLWHGTSRVLCSLGLAAIAALGPSQTFAPGPRCVRDLPEEYTDR